MTRATETATAFGTNERLVSWIWVIDWKAEIANPTTSAVIRIGAAISPAVARAWTPISLCQRGRLHRLSRDLARAFGPPDENDAANAARHPVAPGATGCGCAGAGVRSTRC